MIPCSWARQYLPAQDASRQILADFSGHIVPLCRIDDRVFIGIFLLDFFIHLFDESQNAIISVVFVFRDISRLYRYRTYFWATS